MAAGSSAESYPPHPYLNRPSLFITNLPTHVTEMDIKNSFQSADWHDLRATVSFNRSKNRRRRGALRPQLDFADLNSAEKALATLHRRPIPNIDPPVILQFSTTVSLNPIPAPDPAVSPRIIKSLPPGCTEATLYDAIRPYGPLYSVRIDPTAGGLVQFWTEDNAQDVEICLLVAQPPMVLKAYDACSLFCSNICFDLNAAALRTHFAEFGNVTSTEIITHAQTRKSRGIGFVTFSLASEAAAAMAAMHGAEIQWRTLSVTYRVLRKKNDHGRPARNIVEEPSSPPTDPGPSTEDSPPSKPAPSSDEPSPEPVHRTKRKRKNEVFKSSVTQLNKELECLQALYATELEARKAAQADAASLRNELEGVNRALEMAESRLKIMQLEADRPLWEQAKKKREEDERAERAREEERRRAAEIADSRRRMEEFQAQERERKRAAEVERLRREAEERARREKEERERLAREKAERERKEKEAREKREREARWRAATQAEELRCERRDEQMWGAGTWTPIRALARLRLQMDEFDRIKFSEAQPLTFRAIPWPVLTDPLDMDVEQIDWHTVEAFFARAKSQMAANIAEYNSLVERVHRMFHPDKWKARGVLLTVMDEELRASLETAGNIVAQAMTPLWRKSKGYT
ncbi:hypothetical protein B0H15DRAFT_856518 [Mycena belliarum]|uniref:RRM domain-containing protein n=1 Tax=Mycena belliarum TaxID=1033014 RepID=A0AAD6TY95_9AGAR|nr:hypothetical protein B0H15DRAFT_856518 [Mycena belliae]